MTKVFWQFPTNSDSKEKWNRLDPDTRKQVLWYQHPIELDDKKYEEVKKMLEDNGPNAVKEAEEEYEFA